MGFELALVDHNTLVMMPKEIDSQQYDTVPQRIEGLRLIVNRHDGNEMEVDMCGLASALAAWRTEDPEDLILWIQDLLELGLTNDRVPHRKLGEIMNLINSIRDLAGSCEVVLIG